MTKFTKSRYGRIAAGVVGLTAGVFMLFGFVGVTHAASLTSAQIDSIINLLESFGADAQVVSDVRTTLNGGTPSGGGSSSSGGGDCTFTRSLFDGVEGSDVTCLQDYLTGTGHFTFSGGSTGYFGPVTTAAVAAWQAANGVSPAVGYFGPLSQAKYNEVAGSSSTGDSGDSGDSTPTPTPGTGLTVGAGSQPAASLAPDDAARVPFTRFTLTAGNDGDVTVDSIVVERGGLASDSNFAGVVLVDETSGQQVGIARSLNSDHQVTLGTSFVVPSGTTRTYVIGGNMAADNSTRAGEVASLSVVAVNSTATVSGALPITGAGHTINATLTIGDFDSPQNGTLVSSADASLDVGTTNKVFTSVKWTAGGEDMYFKSIRWEQTGTASASDLGNVVTLVDGTSYPTTMSGDFYTTVFPGNGILITKGNTVEASVRGDVLDGSSRTVKFDIQKQSDVYVVGKTYGYGALPDFGSNSSGTDGTFQTTDDQYYDAYSHTISAGTMTVSGWTQGVPAQNVAENVNGQPIGGFTVDVRGEAITVQTMKFGVGITTGSSEIADITSITVVDENGNTLASATDGTDTDQYELISFSDAVTFQPGITNIKLVGKYGTDFSNNDVIQASTTPSGWSTVKGDTTGVSITPSPSTAVSGQNMTLKAGSLNISQSSQPTARTVIGGAQDFEFARYVFDATSSGENVRVTTFPAKYSFATVSSTDLTGCFLYDGGTAVTDVLHPSVSTGNDETFTFTDSGLIVAKGTAKTLSLKCDVSSGATSGSFTWGNDDNASTFSAATGVTSGTTIAETWTSASGQAMTASSGGSYTVANDTSILYKMAQAGSSDVTLAAFRFTAGAAEDVMIKQVALELGNTASNAPTDLLNEEVSLWHDGAQVGTAKFVGSNSDFATSTLTSAVTVEAGETETITVKAALSEHDVNSAVASFGAFVTVNYDGGNVGINGNYATGVDSGTTISSGTTTDVTTNGVRVFNIVPSIAVNSSGGTLAPGGDLYSFTVTNPGDDDIVFQKFTFTVATTGGAVRDFILYGNGSAFNTSVSTLAATTLELTNANSTQAAVVPANSSKTYVLKASTVVDTASVAETINLTLLADTAYPDALTSAQHMGTVTTVEAGTEATANNIIWTPGSTTTPTNASADESNLDWTNAYGMPGFPSNSNFPTQSWTRPN